MLIDEEETTVLEKVQRLQDGLVAFSTDGDFDGGNAVYKRLRRELLDRADLRDKVPEFIRRYRDLSQFWHFIKTKFRHYAERRDFLWDSFRPLIDDLEAFDRAAGLAPLVKRWRSLILTLSTVRGRRPSTGGARIPKG